MKRDMDLIRKILQTIESSEYAYGLEEMPEIEGYSKAAVSYHINILEDAHLVDATPVNERARGYTDWYGINLTWDGQEFLSATKDNSIWEKANELIFKPGASFTFQLLKQWLEMKLKEKLGLP